MDESQREDEPKTFGWRHLPGAVNLRDFAQMVGGEVRQIGTSVSLAFRLLSHLPLGPFLFVGGLLIALLRALLLVLVVPVFGGAILVITVVRGIARIARGGDASTA